MLKGVQCYTIRDYLKDAAQFKESMKKVKAIGYDCVQSGVPSYLTARETKDFLDEVGLTSCSTYASYEKMAEEPAAITAAIKDAKIMDTNCIAIGTMPEEMRDHEEGFKKYAASLNKIAAELNKEGCKLVYHHHALEFFSLGGGRHGMDILFNETDPSCVYFTLDTHWLASGGVNPIEWINKAKGRMTFIHFKDYAIGPEAQSIEGVSKMFAEVGEGNINWPEVIKACKETGVEAAVVEQDICKGCPFDSLKISYDNMVKFNV